MTQMYNEVTPNTEYIFVSKRIDSECLTWNFLLLINNIIYGIRINPTPKRKIPAQKIPTHVFKYSHLGFNFFVFSLLSPLSLILLKRLVILCFRSSEVRLVPVN